MTATPIVVVSPHSDDGVLSLGASMARWARRGHTVRLVTVLALDPDSAAPAGGWDRRGGFATEAHAARARREEDQAACELLGVVPVWLPFGSVDYERHGDTEDVWAALRDLVEGAHLVLLPGAPLTHPDHVWVHDLVSDRLPGQRIARYAEQPYARRAGEAGFPVAPADARGQLSKWRALRRYRSQLPLLGLGSGWGTGPIRLARERERIAWPEGHDVRRL